VICERVVINFSTNYLLRTVVMEMAP